VNALPLPVKFNDLAAQHAEVAAAIAAGWAEVIETSSFILGPAVERFETEYAAFCETPYCVGVASGTDAIELLLWARGVIPGNEVILPANSFIATALAVARIGARPVLVDCDPEYLLIDPDLIPAAITQNTAAVIPVHLFGQMAPMAEVAAAADGLVVVEDAAQSHGATQEGDYRSRAVATSFYPGKNLGAYGDAGAILTDSEETANRVRALRNYGSTVKYHHPQVGFNSRLDSLQAVVLAAKLRHLAAWNETRRVAADYYLDRLANIAEVRLPKIRPGNCPVWHLFVIRVQNRDRVIEQLQQAGIQTGIHYPRPIHAHQAFAKLGYVWSDFPVAEAAAEQMISLPLHPHITAEQQDYVVAELIRAVRKAG